jgi:hypothetical protein
MDRTLINRYLLNRYLASLFCIALALAIFLVGCGTAYVPPITRTPLSTRQTAATDSPTPIPTADPLPNDIVVYPGAQPVLAQRITSGTLYYYRSTANLQAVTTFYVNQMPRQGWTQTSAALNGSQGNYLAYSKGTRSVTLYIVPDPIVPAQTDISITVSNS